MRHITAICAVACWLGGCTWLSPSSLSTYSLDYNGAIQDSSDKLLVINILRARDQAPLHFGDIPSIHETVQFTAGITPTFIFGPVHAQTGSSTVAPTVNIQDAPSFEMDNLDTQDFVTGIMSPIQAKVVKYWLDRGLDRRIALLLFFSGVTVTFEPESDAPAGRKSTAKPAKSKETVFILNSPRGFLPQTPDDVPPITDDHGIAATARGIALDGQKKFKLPFITYLSIIDWINDNGSLVAVASDDKTAVGPRVRIDEKSMDRYFRDIARIDPQKYQLHPVEGQKGWYQLYTVADEKKISLCFIGARLNIKGSGKEDDACAGATDEAEGAMAEAPKNPCGSFARWVQHPGRCDLGKGKMSLEFDMRSAGDVVHFLGDLVYRQEHPSALQPGQPLNPTITLAYCPPESQAASPCDDGGVLFTLARGEAPGRFKVAYVDGSYTVGPASEKDHTLEVLAILTQLIDLNKSAKDFRETPTVKIIP